MNKIIYDIELNQIQQNENDWNYYYQYINQIKNKIDLVKLSLYCAKYCFDYNDEITKPLAQKCIDLIEKYLLDPNSITQQELLNTANAAAYDTAYDTANTAYAAAYAAAFYAAFYAAYAAYTASYATVNCLYYCLKIENINMNMPHQYLQILLRSTKQFNIQNYYSKTIEQIVKQDIDKLELVDWNMLLDISNEYYNIDLQEFNYDNIFSRRNLIELIRKEFSTSHTEKMIVP